MNQAEAFERRGDQLVSGLEGLARRHGLDRDVLSLDAQIPQDELFGLTSQIRRAATSVAANIAEGHGREHIGSFIQGLRIAQGSLKELETHLLVSQRVGILAEGEISPPLKLASDIGKMLRSLIRSLQAKGQTE